MNLRAGAAFRAGVGAMVGLSALAVMAGLERVLFDSRSGLAAIGWAAAALGGGLAGAALAPFFGQPGWPGAFRAALGAALSTMLGAALTVLVMVPAWYAVLFFGVAGLGAATPGFPDPRLLFVLALRAAVYVPFVLLRFPVLVALWAVTMILAHRVARRLRRASLHPVSNTPRGARGV